MLLSLGGGRAHSEERSAHLLANPLRPRDSATTSAEPASLVDAPAPPPRPLFPFEIQCRAAERSPVARLLSTERASIRSSHAILHRKRDSEARVAALQRNVLALAAEEARNRDAGTALLTYWAVAEAERTLDLLSTAIDVADLAVSDHERLTRRGLELPTSAEKLLARRLLLEDSVLAAGALRRSLEIGLMELAGLPENPVTTIDPAIDIPSPSATPDADALVADGLTNRPELRMLRLLCSTLDAENADVARAVLAQVSPLLAGQAKHESDRCVAWLCTGLVVVDEQLPALCRELRDWTRDREAAVAAEIRAAAIECTGNVERVEFARRVLELEERMATDLRARLAVGDGDALAIHVADLDVITAQRTLLERRIAWERSRVKLLQARGLLATQCGPGVANCQAR